MMKKLSILSGIAVVLLFGCTAGDRQQKITLQESSMIIAINSADQYYGEKIDPDGALDASAVFMIDLEKTDEVKIKGKILEVCQEMGCWVTIELPDSKSIRVSTDHKFFLPMDISGNYAIVQGKLTKELTSVEDLRHYAEESGKDQDYINSINSPKEEYSIIASGMIVMEQED